MARNDLHVRIPAYFQCPISLELMKSPVALCTGVTYDRSSIQTWLDAGNLTCPATMQPLSSADFVPNLSLHRLIHLWSISTPRSPSPRHRLFLLINRFATASAATFNELSSHLSDILQLAQESAENRCVLANSERFVVSLVDAICKFDQSFGALEFLELAAMALEMVSRESDRSRDQIHQLIFKSNRDCLASISRVLSVGNAQSRIAAAKFLTAIAIDTETKRKIAENESMIADLYGLLISDDDSLIEAGLSALISLTTTRSFKSELVRIGTVRALVNILADTNRKSPAIVKAMEMAELLATCSIGRSAICEDENCVAVIVKRLLKVPEKATEHGIAVLWCLCHLFHNKKAVEAAIGGNALTKCLLVMQSNCSAIAKQMCRDLVKVFRVDSVELGLTNYDTDDLGKYEIRQSISSQIRYFIRLVSKGAILSNKEIA